jgi:hypothetical protein
MLKAVYQGLIVKGQFERKGLAKNGSVYATRRFPLGEGEATKWYDLYFFAPSPALLQLLPEKAVVRGPVTQRTLAVQGRSEPLTVYGGDLQNFEVWNQEAQAWVPIVPQALQVAAPTAGKLTQAVPPAPQAQAQGQRVRKASGG